MKPASKSAQIIVKLLYHTTRSIRPTPTNADGLPLHESGRMSPTNSLGEVTSSDMARYRTGLSHMGNDKRACIDYRRTSELSAGRKLEQHLFRILCAKCVPDSENTDIRRNGQSRSLFASLEENLYGSQRWPDHPSRQAVYIVCNDPMSKRGTSTAQIQWQPSLLK